MPRTVGRYMRCQDLASGGMATVSLGRLVGEAGFSRAVAIKRLHAEYARDPDILAMFVDEARLVSRIRHPNVVPTLDVVSEDGEIFLVLDYVHGESLSRLQAETVRRGERIPPEITVAIMTGVLEGLHAAHQATNERGVPLDIVHRDVSPQNVLVGVDGTAKVLDFGIAKAVERAQTTHDGQLKGKIAYMAPERIRDETADRRSDIWSAAVILWEMLTASRLFSGDSQAAVMNKVLSGNIPPPSATKGAPQGFDAVVAKGLARAPEERYATAREMAVALEKVMPPAPARTVAKWVQRVAKDTLKRRELALEEMETDPAARASVRSYLRDLRGSDTPSPRPSTPPPPDNDPTRVDRPQRPLESPDATNSTEPEPASEPSPQPTTPKKSGASRLAIGVVVAGTIAGAIFYARAQAPASPPPGPPVSTSTTVQDPKIERPVPSAPFASAARSGSGSPALLTPEAGIPSATISPAASLETPPRVIRKPPPAPDASPSASTTATASSPVPVDSIQLDRRQ